MQVQCNALAMYPPHTHTYAHPFGGPVLGVTKLWYVLPGWLTSHLSPASPLFSPLPPPLPLSTLYLRLHPPIIRYYSGLSFIQLGLIESVTETERFWLSSWTRHSGAILSRDWDAHTHPHRHARTQTHMDACKHICTRIHLDAHTLTHMHSSICCSWICRLPW